MIFLHRLPEISTRLGLNLHLEQFNTHALVSVVVLLIPIIIPLIAQALNNLISKLNDKYKPRKFIELAYGYLPLVLAGNLAHYLRLGLNEGGRILPVTMATFSINRANLPLFIAHPAVIAFLQSFCLIIGIILSMILTQKIARQRFKYLLPQHVAIAFLAYGMWQVIVGF